MRSVVSKIVIILYVLQNFLGPQQRELGQDGLRIF